MMALLPNLRHSAQCGLSVFALPDDERCRCGLREGWARAAEIERKAAAYDEAIAALRGIVLDSYRSVYDLTPHDVFLDEVVDRFAALANKVEAGPEVSGVRE